MVNLQQIISWFQTGLFPTADQFRQTWLSFWHKSEKIPQSQIFGLQETIESATQGLIWKDQVANVSDLATTYPNADRGWAAMVTSVGYIYSFNGTAWANTGLRAFPADVATQDDLAQLGRDVMDKFLPDRSFSGFINIDYDHAATHGVDDNFTGYEKSKIYDCGWIMIFEASGRLEISGANPSYILFFNDLNPSSQSFISVVSASLNPLIPNNAKLALVNFIKSENPNGLLNAKAIQIGSGETRKYVEEIRKGTVGDLYTVKGYAVRTDGTVTSSVSGINATEFLPITGKVAISVNGFRLAANNLTPVAFYDANYQFLWAYDGPENADNVYVVETANIPVGSRYIRCTEELTVPSRNGKIIGFNLAALLDHQNFNQKNTFGEFFVLKRMAVRGNGTVTESTSDNIYATLFLPLDKSQDFVVNGHVIVSTNTVPYAFYDKEFKFISAYSDTTITGQTKIFVVEKENIPEDAVFVRCTGAINLNPRIVSGVSIASAIEFTNKQINAAIIDRHVILEEVPTGRNLLNPSKNLIGYTITISADVPSIASLLVNDFGIISNRLRLKNAEYYTISGIIPNPNSNNVRILHCKGDNEILSFQTFDRAIGKLMIMLPADYEYSLLSIKNNDTAIYNPDVAQLELGEIATTFEPFSGKYVVRNIDISEELEKYAEIGKHVILKPVPKGRNFLNPDENLNGYAVSVSVDSILSVVHNTNGILSNKFVLINREYYTVSGIIPNPASDYVYLVHYDINDKAIGDGWQRFLLSDGGVLQAVLPSNYSYSRLSLKNVAGATYNPNAAQLEIGRLATPFEPFLGIAYLVTNIEGGEIKTGGYRPNMMLFGNSTAYPKNTWFLDACAMLGVKGYNYAQSGQLIYQFANMYKNRDADRPYGEVFTHAEFNDFEVLVLSHSNTVPVHIEDRLREKVSDYADYEFIPDNDFSMAWDYVLKQYRLDCYNAKFDPESLWYNTQEGKPCYIIAVTWPSDSRTTYNKSIRILQKKWGFALMTFDENALFSSNVPFEVLIQPTGSPGHPDYMASHMPPVLHSNWEVNPTEWQNNVVNMYHQSNRTGSPIQRRMALQFYSFVLNGMRSVYPEPDTQKITGQYFKNENKAIRYSDGVEITQNGFYTTDFIPINKSQDLIVDGYQNMPGTITFCAFYDSNKNYIDGITNAGINSDFNTLSNAWIANCVIKKARFNAGGEFANAFYFRCTDLNRRGEIKNTSMQYLLDKLMKLCTATGIPFENL